MQQLSVTTSSFFENLLFVSWTNRFRVLFDHDKFIKQRAREIKKHHVKQWKINWTIYKEIIFDLISTQRENINKKRLKLHDQLKKTKSSLTTQIRTKNIEFADFLHRRKMLEMKSISCWCDWQRQTIKHVIMFCSLMNDKDRLRRNDDALNYRQMMQFDRDLKIVVKWLIDHSLLSQYALTSKLLYNDWLFFFVDLYISFFLFILLFSSFADLANAARNL